MSVRHTERYGDANAVPVDVMASIAGYVSREWGDRYRIGYIGERFGTRGSTYAFQVKASDGSRFAVGCTLFGDPHELCGNEWYAWLQDAGIEATVSGVS